MKPGGAFFFPPKPAPKSLRAHADANAMFRDMVVWLSAAPVPILDGYEIQEYGALLIRTETLKLSFPGGEKVSIVREIPLDNPPSNEGEEHA